MACERAKRSLYDDIDFMYILIRALSRSGAVTCSATPLEVLRDFKTDEGNIYETVSCSLPSYSDEFH
jgi:hypothetical protein